MTHEGLAEVFAKLPDDRIARTRTALRTLSVQGLQDREQLRRHLFGLSRRPYEVVGDVAMIGIGQWGTAAETPSPVLEIVGVLPFAVAKALNARLPVWIVVHVGGRRHVLQQVQYLAQLVEGGMILVSANHSPIMR